MTADITTTAAVGWLDTDRLGDYLKVHLPGFEGGFAVRRFAGGQSNPTFRLDTPAGQYVLRRKPPGTLLPSAHAIEREYRVLRALRDTEVPVAAVHHLCEDAQIIGTAFYVMDFVDGRLFWDPALPELNKSERGRVYEEMNRVLAAIHRVDLDAAGLADFGKPGNYYQRQIERWTRQYRAAQMEVQPAMEQLIEWLPAHVPPDDGWVGLIHGDYRLDNLMFARDRLEVIAVFDWELSTLGHPPADLAYQIMQRAMGRDWPIRGLAGLNTNALGIPDSDRYIAAYCERQGIEAIAHWSFYLAFGFFRFASICQGIRQRAAQGNAANADAKRTGDMALPLAQLGWEVARAA